MVRPEEPADAPAIRLLIERAFGRPDEGQLVAALGDTGAVTLSLVAERGGSVVGHVLFSPVTIERAVGTTEAIGLAPLAVLPSCQQQGVGLALVRSGLDALRARGHGAVVVLGSPRYYGRFGFVAASRFGLRGDPSWPEPAFQAIELRPGALTGAAALVRYRPEFYP